MTNSDAPKAGAASALRALTQPGNGDGPAASSANSYAGIDLEQFWSPQAESARPAIQSLRKRLPHFPSPPLRVQRVGQLDAELLDGELLEILLAPVKDAINLIKPTLSSRILPEMLLAMRLALFKLSILDHQASYGSMLQNLRYRNEWAHKGGLQSTSRDQRLHPIQLALYPVITAVIPYAYTRAEMNMARHSYSEAAAPTGRYAIWTLLDRFRRWYALAAFVNFGLFLGNGKYRTLADRILGIRLIHAQRSVHRNVSFEYLNRQLVWHAFTEFLVFLLPLLRPRRMLKYLTRLPIYTTALSAAQRVLPNAIQTRIGLSPGLKRGSQERDDQSDKVPPEIAALPAETCALCWQRNQVSTGTSSTLLRVGLPTSDPLDPSSGALAPSETLARPSAQITDDLTATIPHAADPCGHVYCYHCLASALLSEEAAEDIADDGAWRCLRCNAAVRGLVRA